MTLVYCFLLYPFLLCKAHEYLYYFKKGLLSKMVLWHVMDGAYSMNGKLRNAYNNLVENNVRHHLRDLSIEGRTILILILEKERLRVWTGFTRVKESVSVNGNETWDSIRSLLCCDAL
jgi:hypothetical protein